MFLFLSRFIPYCSWQDSLNIIDISRMYYPNTGVPQDFLRSGRFPGFMQFNRHPFLCFCFLNIIIICVQAWCVKKFLELLLCNTQALSNGLDRILSEFEWNKWVYLWSVSFRFLVIGKIFLNRFLGAVVIILIQNPSVTETWITRDGKVCRF